MRHLLAVAYFLAALTLTTSAHAQTCAFPARCLTQDRVNALVDVACARARAKELEFDGLRREYDAAASGWQRCLGGLDQVEARGVALEIERDQLRAELASRWPWWVWAGVGVLAGAVSVVAVWRI